jgi:hypothetical protein
LQQLDFDTFKNRLRSDPDSRISWGENFIYPKYAATISEPKVEPVEEGWRVRLSNDLFDYVECNRLDIAEGLALALGQQTTNDLDRSAILNTSLPATGVEISTWNSVVASHKAEILYQAMTDAISALDHVVGNGKA